MIVLHILYHPHSPDRILIFGEDPINKPLKLSDSGSAIPGHPAASSFSDLKTCISSIQSESIAEETEITLELPFHADTIICSPEWETLTGTVQPEPDHLRMVSLPALSCPSDILLSLPDGDPSHQNGWVPGGSFRLWMSVSALTRELVLKGRFLPTIGTYRNGGICTEWRPLYSSYDLSRIDRLAASMPPVQKHFLSSGTQTGHRIKPGPAIRLWIKAFLNRILALSGQEDPVDPATSLSPMERLRHAQELTALYFLQGYERHKMPLQTPQITNGWRETFSSWADIPDDRFADEPPFTILCRLQEMTGEKTPDGEIQKNDGAWQISFLVRTADEPDILHPAKRCRDETKQTSSLPAYPDILDEISRISTTITSLVPSVRCTGDDDLPGLFIDESDLPRFLTFDAGELQKAGVELILPDWWGSPPQKAQVRLLFRHGEEKDATKGFGLHTLLDFDYRIAVGDDLIDPAAFRRMVREKTSAIRIRNRWVTLDTGRIQKILDEQGKKSTKKAMTVAEFLRVFAQSEDREDELSLLADDEWTTNLISFIRTGYDAGKWQTPSSFQGTLRPYQQTGLSFLCTCRSVGFGCCLADDMGLGKTPQTIAYLLACKEEGVLDGPALIVCPTSIIGNWERELSRFSPDLRVCIHHGPGRKKDSRFIVSSQEYDLIITSYALIPRDIAFLSSVDYSALILDEVQNVKNAATRQYQAVRRINAAHRIALTGTPVENHLSEIWSIMEILNPGYLGTSSSFQKIYAGPVEKGGDEEKARELRRIIRPFLIRRVKTDPTVIQDLPEKMEMKVYCTLTHEQAALYQATLDDLAGDLENTAGIARRGKILASLTRLKQICNHPSLVAKASDSDHARSGKVLRLIEMLDEVYEEGEAAVIFTQYATFAQILKTIIHTQLQTETLVMTGGTPRQKREEMITRFMRNDGPHFFVISLKAGGTGLNLMRATHVFHIDRWWNPAVEDQATDRTYRIGQTRAVQVHMMIAAGTLEEQIDEMIERKRTLAGHLLAGGEDWLTELPSGELMDILRLRTDIFGDDA